MIRGNRHTRESCAFFSKACRFAMSLRSGLQILEIVQTLSGPSLWNCELSGRGSERLVSYERSTAHQFRSHLDRTSLYPSQTQSSTPNNGTTATFTNFL